MGNLLARVGPVFCCSLEITTGEKGRSWLGTDKREWGWEHNGMWFHVVELRCRGKGCTEPVGADLSAITGAADECTGIF